MCISTYRPIVGNGEAGYEGIVGTFEGAKRGGFARLIMVNPLHEALPKLVLVVSCTYNYFDSKWVRDQWENIDKLWGAQCLETVGPIIGHASDGNSRRQQLRLQDYMSKTRIRVCRLHDQDFIHNGKY
jgi:hypothetical protein